MTDTSPTAKPDDYDVPAAKSSRTTQRSKVTKAIKNVERLMSDNVKELRPKELQRKLDLIKAAIQDEAVAQEHLLKCMSFKKASEAEIQKEIDGSIDREVTYDVHIDNIMEAITMGNLLLQYQELTRKANTWLDHAVPTSTVFTATGNELTKEFQEFIRELTPYSTHTDLGPLLPKAQDLLEKLLININKGAPAPATPAAGATPSTARRQAPYQIKAPTFSGKAIDFQTFYDRFSEVLKNHWDSYSDGDRCCILAEAMLDPVAKDLVESYAPAGYDVALQQLKDRYGRASAIYPKYVEELITRGRYEYSQESMVAIIRRVEHTLDAMAKIKGKTMEQLTVALVVRDFDDELAKEWAKHLGPSDAIPDSKQLIDFIRPLSHNLPVKTSKQSSTSHYQTSSKSSQHNGHHNNSHKKEDKKAAPSATPATSKSCAICKGHNHSLARCQIFLDSDVNKRWTLARQNKYCVNCLHQSHTVANCTSTYTCRTCQSKHHSLLHKGEEADKPKPQTGTSLLTTANLVKGPELRLLPSGFIHTAIITVFHGDSWITVRAAVDTCCTSSIMSERVASHLKANRLPINIEMTGAVASTKLKQSAIVGIRPAFPSQDRVELEVAIMPRSLASTPPSNREEVANHPKLQDIRLADEEMGGPIDFIIGAQVHTSIMQEKALKTCDELSIIAVPTIFGYTVGGSTTTSSDNAITSLQVELKQDSHLDHLLTRLWEFESVPTPTKYSPDEEAALRHFQDSVKVEDDGRYTVCLPRVKDPPALGKSRQMALSRFLGNERSLQKRGKLESFNSEMQTYLTLQHAEPVPVAELNLDGYYLPIHGVFKDQSTTTKVRPVFDGSARTSSGTSLNDQLLPGPALQPLITDILLMFRRHQVAFSADVGKMFREIQLDPTERDCHRFLLRNSNGKITDFRMKRLTFGVTSSPFLANSVLQHLAKTHLSSHPLASHCILHHFYVDDLLAGAATVEEAKVIFKQLCSLFSMAKMTLRKWRTNDSAFRDSIPDDLVETADLTISSDKDSIKALGVHWDVSRDLLHISAPELPQATKVTKKHISSVSARIYDVLGFFCPYVVLAKSILQELWLLKVSWEEEVPEDIQQRWHTWTRDLPSITKHPISRRYFSNTSKVVSTTIHGFSDASDLAYGAVTYLRCVHEDGSISTSIIMAKARVRPLKVTTIPKLELQAASLLSQLLVYVAAILKVPLDQVQPWTDSTIVLGGLRKMPHSITEVFVRNRIAAIQEALPQALWRHISSGDNPADIASRGSSVDDLISSSLWWSGPSWLSCPENTWPAAKASPLPRSLPGVKLTVLTAALTPVEDWDLWRKFSSYTHLDPALYLQLQIYI